MDDLSYHYSIGKVLGKGSFGEVVQAVHLKSGEARAIKIIKKSRIEEKISLVKLMMQEIAVLMQSDHPSLIKVYEMYQDDDHYYIISELMKGGELYLKILQLKQFS
jgi:calcium-dependent protein kinase